MCTRTGCVLCESADCTPYIQLDHRQIVRCGGCGFVYARTYSPAALTAHYRESYYSSPEDPRIDAWIEENQDVWLGIVADLAPHMESVGTLLDVGAGTGGFLLAAHAAWPRLKLSAIESSPEACVHLRRALPEIEIPAGTAEELHELPSTFECITLLQVLEHVADPRAVCRAIFDRLVPGGLFLVTVPNRLSYQSLGGAPERSLCYSNPTHLQFFDRRRLAALLRESGFTNVVRVARLGGGSQRGIGALAQFALRRLGISNELRFMAWRPR